MFGTVLAKVAIGMIAKLMTDVFLSKLLIEGMRAWSRQTENPYDDRVTEAAADALGVPREGLKQTIKIYERSENSRSS